MAETGSAVVGTGFIAPVHIEALRRLGRRVVGLLGSSLEKGRTKAAAWGVPRVYASLEELLNDPEVGTVHLTSPNRFHFEQARRVIDAGKHVVCEKPLAMTSTETAELVAQVGRAGTGACVCYNVRYYPLCLELRQRLAAGLAGQVFHVAGSYVQDWLLYPTDFNWRVSATEGGPLRAIADIGTHWFDLIWFVTGLEVEEVCADLRTVWPVRIATRGSVETFQSNSGAAASTEEVPIQTEDYGAVLLRFRGGTRGVVHVSQVTSGRKNCIRFEIAGSGGAAYWNSEHPNDLWLGHREKANELLIRDPSLLTESARSFANYPGGHNEGYPDTFKQLFRAFYDYVDRGDFSRAQTFPTFEDGHREAVLCEAILRSHREGRWISLK